jgi:hypothetical protein
MQRRERKLVGPNIFLTRYTILVSVNFISESQDLPFSQFTL